jgi:DNA-binding CsgD family transcriptional regulator
MGLYVVRTGEADLLDVLYSASEDPGVWPEFLIALGQLFHTECAGLISHDIRAREYSAVANLGVSLDAFSSYSTYYGATDPCVQAMRSRGLREWIGLRSDLCPHPVFRRTEFYYDFCKRFRWSDRCGMVVRESENRVLNLSLMRLDGEPDFNHDHALALAALLPHVRRSLQLRRGILDLRQAVRDLAGVIDALDVGIVALDRNGKIRFMNRLAESLLRAGEALTAGNGCLSATDPKNTDLISELLKRVGSRQIGTVPWNAITMRRGNRSLIITVLPGTAIQGMVPDFGGVLLTITDPRGRPRTRERLLTGLFQLTPAEIRVSMYLLAGLDPREIAARTGTTAETVRFQLKTIYRKTSTSRQSQLVALLSRMPGAVK